MYLQNFFKFKECNDLSKTIISKGPSKAIILAVWINGRVICDNVTWQSDSQKFFAFDGNQQPTNVFTRAR